jgi:hypothetical protein
MRDTFTVGSQWWWASFAYADHLLPFNVVRDPALEE